MGSKNALRRTGILMAFVILGAIAAPAFAADDANSPAAKSTAAHPHKKIGTRDKSASQKPKQKSLMDKDTTSQYPPQPTPGGGY